MKTELAWHFSSSTLRDGSPVPRIGVPLRHKGPLRICKSGLHASLDPFDALRYAPGSLLHRVECSGQIIHGHDKLVCRQRVIVASIDATDLLRAYARAEALLVAHLWSSMPPVVREYLETGRAELRVAADAAAWAAWATAGAAATAARAVADAATGAASRARFNAAVVAAFKGNTQ